MALLLAHREAAPPPLASLRPDCPAPMKIAVERMMAKQPAQRFPSVREAVATFTSSARDDADAVRTAMMTLARSNPKPLRRVSTPRSPAPAFAPRKRPRAEERAAAGARPAAQRRRRWLVPAGIAVIAAAAAVAGWLGVKGRASRGAESAGSESTATAARVPATSRTDSSALAGPAASQRESIPAAPGVLSSQRRHAAPGPRAARSKPPTAATRDTQSTGRGSPTISVPTVGYVTIGARSGRVAAVLYVNGVNHGVLSGLKRVEVPAGRVRLQLRAAGCADWDTVLTVSDSSRIGYRRPSCPGDTL
jgi:hypothetical protein